MKRNNHGLVDFIIDNMESQGYSYVGITGKPGEEIITFKNEAGEIKTVEFGFTPVKRQNIQIAISEEKCQE